MGLGYLISEYELWEKKRRKTKKDKASLCPENGFKITVVILNVNSFTFPLIGPIRFVPNERV
jgi:hypothetical protein